MKRKWKRTVVAIISITMSLSGAVLYIAHDITNIPLVPKQWSDKWALLVILAGILNKAGQSIISHLEPETPNARSDSQSNLRSQTHANANPDAASKPHARSRRPHSDSPSHANPNSHSALSDSSS